VKYHIGDVLHVNWQIVQTILVKIVLLKEISKGSLCLSRLEKQSTFLLAISFPEELSHLKGNTGELTEYVQRITRY